MAADDKLGNATPGIPPTANPNSPSHPTGTGETVDRDKYADTDRLGATTRLAFKDAVADAIDFRATSIADQTGDSWDEYGVKEPDPWDVNRPIGGKPDPYVGRPKP